MNVIFTPIVLATALSVAWLPTQASTIHSNDVTAGKLSTWQSADAHQTWTSGTVVRVSVERGKVTIEHGPIKNLEMMAMTMPFTVADSSLLEGLAAGDKIEFVAGKNGDELVVEALRRPAS
jgi:Cu/Ag efflux protein CusF